MNNLRENCKGITLIALVITIIVLLILATITIAILTGDNGVLNQAQSAKDSNRGGEVQQIIDTTVNENRMAEYMKGGTQKSRETVIQELYDDDKLTDKEVEELQTTNIIKIGSITVDFSELGDISVAGVAVAKGDFVKYDVEYTDMYYPSYQYTSINGWRILSYTDNKDGTYSNVKLISTGIPAKLYYYYSETTYSADWYEKDTTKLNSFKTLLNGKDENEYNFYIGSYNYYALWASAGMYYNFGSIVFRYGTTKTNKNQGWFTSIKNGSNTYNSSYIETKDDGSETYKTVKAENLFLTDSANEVRLLTLPEVNAVTKTDGDVDSTTQISTTADTIGLYRLDQLKNVSGMTGYNYSGSGYYWVASPWPGNSYNVCDVHYDGSMTSSGSNNNGVRPVVSIQKSNIKFKLSDDETYYEMIE